MSWSEERGSRHERGYGYQWQKRRSNVLTRDDHLCQPCFRTGRITPATEVDHITPKHLDGDDDYDNLQAICAECHKVKTKAEAIGARGGKPRPRYTPDGWPIWD